VLQTLQKENALLRAIVDRQYQEDSRRMQARDALSKELDELGNRTDSIRQQIKVLATPLSTLSDEERALLKTPAATMREDPTKLSGTITSKRGGTADPAAKLTGENSIMASDAKRLFAKGDLDGAAEKYEAILKSEPKSVFALSNLGVIRFRQERVEEAEKALQGALAVDPQDAFSLSVLGIVHYRQGRFDDAVSVLTRAIAINPNNHETHNYLGITYSQKGYQEAAEKELLKAIEIKPDYADAHFNLAVVYASQNPPSLELARKHYRRAVDLGMQKDPELEKLLAK
jgi:tetratricopeptide (TPR) repeat protein